MSRPPRGTWVEEWKHRKNINLKPTSFDKLVEVKRAMGAVTWEDLCNKLYEEKVKKNIIKL